MMWRRVSPRGWRGRQMGIVIHPTSGPADSPAAPSFWDVLSQLPSIRAHGTDKCHLSQVTFYDPLAGIYLKSPFSPPPYTLPLPDLLGM